ncbi:MAG: GWxTD domain-containing protein [Bacteroidales bacterium]|jgi:GWxTD domain-containing protein|nr:GWxTD domain-containing protein [Bacteroidales bacterium]
MKKIFILLFSIVLWVGAYANVEVYLLYAFYNSPEGPYVETYMSTIGESLVYKETQSGTYQAEIEILLLFKQSGNIVHADKYSLFSPEINDISGTKPNFVDVQRISLANGIYNFEIHVKDKNSESAGSIYADIISVEFSDKDLSFGGIEFIESVSKTTQETIISKNGYDIIPYVSNFFPPNVEKLSFYIELYNSDKVINDDFILRYYIENYETSREIDKYSRFKKMSGKNIIPFIGELNIKDLPSGNYNLVLDIRDRENQSLKKEKYFFQRSNLVDENAEIAELVKEFDIYATFSGEMSSIDSLVGYIKSLRPIANINEQRFIDHQVKGSSLGALQNFFVQFWISRNNINPNDVWKEYNEQIKYVNRLYQTSIRKGYETDMGVIYLKYGAPNSIYTSKHEPSAYPYEIWTYWKTPTETNRKFVFYNPNIVGKDFELLHSNATGEVKAPNWERMLQKRNNTFSNFDNLNADESWGSRALEEFNK